ncbi:hypothetical protein CCAX7_36120 [Capsulimonas corticalis]|uniref:Uncharacterized protein n=1 Tax=Capsulimonas corticalis TaxID=2219043 RepID=A0A402D6Y0_9BACT|nr:HD domain-containing phosphohydrolase [Capsulimonas corticalis]BDI31561.1 hypothetical protein CCAX7_36120 [Capsulimonas corticalis]
MNAPLPRDEQRRLTLLGEARILDTPPEDAFDDITKLAAQICDVPIAAISLIDEERQWFKSVIGLNVTETARDQAFCAHAILQPDLLIVHDALEDTRFADNALVIAEPGIRFYAGAPLLTSDGIALGSLCVIDRVARKLSDEQKAILQMLARQVAGRIELQRQIVTQGQLIAERSLAQSALMQREEELTAIIEHAVEGIYLFDPSTRRVIKSNAALRTMLGYTEEQLMQLTLYDIVGHVRSSIDRTVEALWQGKEVALGERQYLRKDGSVIIVEVSGRVITYQDQLAVCVVVHNLTPQRASEDARRAAEASYQGLFENAAEGIFQTTPQGRYLRANSALARIYGYESSGQMIVEVSDVSTQLYIDEGRRAEFTRLMASNGGVTNFESQIRRRDGSVIWISESARSVFSETGTLICYEGFVQDITDRKDWEMQRETDLIEARFRADHDSLTELWNHRAFHRQAEQHIAEAARCGESLALIMIDIDNFEFFNGVYGHVTGDEVLRMVANRLQTVCGVRDVAARFGGDEFALLLADVGFSSKGELERELTAKLHGLTFCPESHGAPLPITCSLGAVVYPAEGSHRLELLHIADERLRRAKTGGAQDTDADHMREYLHHAIAGFSMLDALVNAVDNKDRYTRRHSEDVMDHCLVIARELGMGEEFQHTLAVAALLHDVGKIGVPDAVLRKPGNLTDAEYAAVKQHPEMGAAIVSAVPGLEATLNAIRYHHECYNGRGYPMGLRGEEIPLIARIMAVADAYSAMTMDRPYRKGMANERALSILSEGIGEQWDKECVHAFLRAKQDATMEAKYIRLAA